MRKIWVQKIICEGKLPKDIYLYSELFTADCFEHDFKEEFETGSITPIYKLKYGSIPTIFSYSETTPKREASVRRSNASRKKELVNEVMQGTTSLLEHGMDDSFPTLLHTPDQIDVVDNISFHEFSNEREKFVNSPTNTDLSFNPFDYVTFSCSSSETNVFYSKNSDNSNTDNDASSADEDFHEHDDDEDYSIHDGEINDNSESICDEEISEAIDNSFIENDLSCDADADVVFFSSLLQLLKFCLLCKPPALRETVIRRGTAISVILLCEEGHSSNWKLQPIFNGIYAGNLLVAAATLFNGSTYTHMKEISNILRLQLFSEATFLRIQRRYLFPAINFVYEKYQKKAIEECVTTRNFLLAGDGKCDSPGFSAKYCTYSLMNSENNQVIDFQVINVGETGSSSTMEKEGLIRVLSRVQCHNFNIQSLTTDRHVQIIKHMRERTNIKHQFDIWHTSKSVKKKRREMAELTLSCM